MRARTSYKTPRPNGSYRHHCSRTSYKNKSITQY